MITEAIIEWARQRAKELGATHYTPPMGWQSPVFYDLKPETPSVLWRLSESFETGKRWQHTVVLVSDLIVEKPDNLLTINRPCFNISQELAFQIAKDDGATHAAMANQVGDVYVYRKIEGGAWQHMMLEYVNGGVFLSGWSGLDLNEFYPPYERGCYGYEFFNSTVLEIMKTLDLKLFNEDASVWR